MNLIQESRIVDGNKLIAEFDGWYRKLEVNKGSDLNWFHKEYSTQISENILIPSIPRNFKYHSSWDWLMPVVEKIDRIANININPRIVRISRMYLQAKKYAKDNNIKTFDDVPPIVEYTEHDFITNTWFAVVEFIKWYNAKEETK